MVHILLKSRSDIQVDKICSIVGAKYIVHVVTNDVVAGRLLEQEFKTIF